MKSKCRRPFGVSGLEWFVRWLRGKYLANTSQVGIQTIWCVPYDQLKKKSSGFRIMKTEPIAPIFHYYRHDDKKKTHFEKIKEHTGIKYSNVAFICQLNPTHCGPSRHASDIIFFFFSFLSRYQKHLWCKVRSVAGSFLDLTQAKCVVGILRRYFKLN